MTKAIDMVRHLQYANVCWNGNRSRHSAMNNGVKKGAVLSAILYCIYVNNLFRKLREKMTRCWINGDFVGIVGYADENFVMSSTFDGLQQMLDTCEVYANEHNLT